MAVRGGHRGRPAHLLPFVALARRNGRVGFSFGGGGGGAAKVVLTLDDLIFINTQISKRVSPEWEFVSSFFVCVCAC